MTARDILEALKYDAQLKEKAAIAKILKDPGCALEAMRMIPLTTDQALASLRSLIMAYKKGDPINELPHLPSAEHCAWVEGYNQAVDDLTKVLTP